MAAAEVGDLDGVVEVVVALVARPFVGMPARVCRELSADELPIDTLPIDAAGVAEELLPVLEILPLQRLAWQLALDRGEDPDRPRGLSKVTRTW